MNFQNPVADRENSIGDVTLASLEFHNCHLEAREAELWHLSRYPKAVRHALSERGRMVSMDACGVEIRFVTPAPNVRVTLSSIGEDAKIQIYRGPFLVATHSLAHGAPTTVHLAQPERLTEANNEILCSGGFAPNVWRVVLDQQRGGIGGILFHYIETFGHPIRPPTPEEKPAVRWLAYGSSITHSMLGGYPYHAARILHWDVYGKGLSGACFIEPETVDYLAELAAASNISIITAELGVNMRNAYSVEEFALRANYLAKTFRNKNARVPIILITAFTNSGHHPRVPTEWAERQAQFDAVLRDIARERSHDQFHLIEGTDLLSDFTLLSADVLHPSSGGHALMGHHLADRLRPLVECRDQVPSA